MNKTIFQLVEEREIGEVNGTARLYRHIPTGAQILSVANSDENKCFGVNFRTPPRSSRGVAHILEHSVLCGSERFPLKEPFVNLLKGSLQTFLNAFTYPDKTCYPVSSANLQDFYNLIDVYLDAVFHPTISENTFRQEGWHLEADTPDGPWQYKGVVYNEMKGVYSSPLSILGEESQHSVFPDTLYSLDSGGNPEEIPNLTYADFRDFHARYYHPCNARFFFWGDDPEEERLAILEKALAPFGARTVDSRIPLQEPFATPRQIEVPYAVPEGAEDRKSLFTMNWLLGERTDLELNLTLEILEHVLEGMPGSPLRRALISSGLGEDTAGCGLETELRQMYYSTGLQGIRKNDVPKAEVLIFDTLAQLAEEGIPANAVEAAVNTVEFMYRESNFGNFPRGLAAMLQALSTWNYDGNPLDGLEWEKAFASVKQKILSGKPVLEDIIRNLFLNNPARTTVILVPDKTLASRRAKAEQDRVDAAQASLSSAEREEVCRITKELKEAQLAPDSPEALATIPNLKVSDMPLKNVSIPRNVVEGDGLTLVSHDQPTRGIAYTKLLLPLPELDKEKLALLPILTRVLRETGTRDRDYSELGAIIASKTGGIGISHLILPRLDGDTRLYLSVAGKAVYDKIPDLFAIEREMLTAPCRDPERLAVRLREMLMEDKARLEQGLVSSGHTAVALRIQSRTARDAALAEATSGIAYLKQVRNLLERLEENQEGLVQEILNLEDLLIANRHAVAGVTAEASSLAAIGNEVKALAGCLPGGETTTGTQTLAPSGLQAGEAFITPSQVNYVGKGTNLYQAGYTFSGSALVILRYLRMGYLWETVRVKGGAYGASCSLNRVTGSFTCTSYRDPNVLETLAAYDGIADYLASFELDAEELSRAIVGAIGDVDTYLLPDARGARSLASHLAGDTEELRQVMRDQILGTSVKDFRDFAAVMAEARNRGTVCVIGGQKAEAMALEQGWNTENLF